MNEYYMDIKEQTLIIRRVTAEARKFLAGAPEGVLQVTNSHGSIQYRVRDEAGEKVTYLKKKDTGLAKALAQKEYCRRILERAEPVERKLAAFERKHAGVSASVMYEALTGAYLMMPKGKRALVEPYVLTDEAFVECWLARPAGCLAFKEGMPEIYTERGERVRSKSEKMIADKLFMLGVPYRYESSIIFENGETVCPDFTILDLAERKDILFEHFGLMGDEDYQNRAVWKIGMYERSGYMLGESFLFTMETADQPLDMRNFEKMIRNRLRMRAGGRRLGQR